MVCSKSYFPAPPPSDTNLLTSATQCWVQRKMVSSSNSPHFQPFSLSLESTAQSSLRSVCVVVTCVCIFVVIYSLFNRTLLLLRWLHSQGIPIRLMTTSQELFAAFCSVMESQT